MLKSDCPWASILVAMRIEILLSPYPPFLEGMKLIEMGWDGWGIGFTRNSIQFFNDNGWMAPGAFWRTWTRWNGNTRSTFCRYCLSPFEGNYYIVLETHRWHWSCPSVPRCFHLYRPKVLFVRYIQKLYCRIYFSLWGWSSSGWQHVNSPAISASVAFNNTDNTWSRKPWETLNTYVYHIWMFPKTAVPPNRPF